MCESLQYWVWRYGHSANCCPKFLLCKRHSDQKASSCLPRRKPVTRQGRWEGSSALFWMPATWEVGRLLSKGWLPSTTPHSADCQGARAFLDWRRGLHAETAQSALMVILRLSISGLMSVILIVLGTVGLQFQGQFLPISWGQFWERWQLLSWPWSGHRQLTSPTWWGFQHL